MTELIKPYACRLESGAKIPGDLETAARNLEIDFCDVAAFGELKNATFELDGADVPFKGPFCLTNLRGRIRRVANVTLSDFTGTIARQTDNGIDVLGGKLKSADIVYLELAMIPLVSCDEKINTSSKTGDAKESKADFAVDAFGTKKTKTKNQWAEALAESRELEKSARKKNTWVDEEQVAPNNGDIINHRQFGRCKVVKLTDDHISLQKPDGRIVQLGLAILKFVETGTEDNATVFDVSVKRP